MYTVTLMTGRGVEQSLNNSVFAQNMSARFRPSIHITVKGVIFQDRRQPHTHTGDIHNNNNMINSTMCSFSAMLMLSGQSIISLMGMWLVKLMTLCWCSVIRVKCNPDIRISVKALLSEHVPIYRCILILYMFFFQTTNKLEWLSVICVEWFPGKFS